MGCRSSSGCKRKTQRQRSRMIAAGQVRMELKEDVPRLWLRVTVTGSEGTGVAIVQDRHDNVAYLESDGNVLRDTRSAAEAEDAPDYGALSVETIWEFCTHAPLARLARAEEAVRLNTALSEEGRGRDTGCRPGKTLAESGMLGGGTAMDAVCAGCAGRGRADGRRAAGCDEQQRLRQSGRDMYRAGRRPRGGGWAGAMKRSCGPRRQRIC